MIEWQSDITNPSLARGRVLEGFVSDMSFIEDLSSYYYFYHNCCLLCAVITRASLWFVEFIIYSFWLYFCHYWEYELKGYWKSVFKMLYWMCLQSSVTVIIKIITVWVIVICICSQAWSKCYPGCFIGCLQSWSRAQGSTWSSKLKIVNMNENIIVGMMLFSFSWCC